MALEQELQTYNQARDTIRDHEGEFVLVKGDQIVDFFETYADALKSGYERFELQPFMVKKVDAIEQVQYFTRNIECRI